MELIEEMKGWQMKDSYGRVIDYLRISITDRCNLRCVYCMPEDGIVCMKHEDILRYEEIVTICKTMADMGLKHVKITGGEPLVRKGCEDLIRKIKEIPQIETVTITTNGIMLEEKMEALVDAGVDGINISLDTLDENAFRTITRGGDLHKVLKGLKKALMYPEVTVKVNCVLGGDQWQDVAISMAALAKELPVHVRFIELMPAVIEGIKQTKLQDQVKEVLESYYGRASEQEPPMGFGPSQYFSLKGFQGQIGFISAISHKFCKTCNRVRLTADGNLRLCLQSRQVTDLKTPLREGREKELVAIIQDAVDRKPKEHHFEETAIETVSMSQIGG